MKVRQIIPFRLEWNDWNGFIMQIFQLECETKHRGFNGELFGVHISHDCLIIEILFIHFDIKSPFF